MNLSELPADLHLNIAEWIPTLKDLRTFSQTCRAFRSIAEDPYLWLMLAEHRFGKEATRKRVAHLEPPEDPAGAPDYKSLYIDMLRRSQCAYADELGVAWMNGTFWRMVDTVPDSPKVVSLRSVCWFDVQANLQNVAPGTYIPYFRILLGTRARGLERIELGCGMERDGEITSSVVYNLANYLMNPTREQWFTLELEPFTIDTEDGFSNIRLWMVDHSTSWKFGPVAIDTIGLMDASVPADKRAIFGIENVGQKKGIDKAGNPSSPTVAVGEASVLGGIIRNVGGFLGLWMPATLLALPVEVRLNVVAWLVLKDLRNYFQTCRACRATSEDPHLWLTMAERRFGRLATRKRVDALEPADGPDYRSLYLDMLRRSQCTYAPEMGIIWLNGYYWEMVDDIPNSISPQVARLNSVHWFDVQTTLHNVVPGTYVPYFRVYIGATASGLDVVDLSCGVVCDTVVRLVYVCRHFE
ncbi:hypothetical protein HK101_010760 [Irineochytrium annulatum]|nr:hypothetical protein HK101_010760 [Irineochytrium annulatum]